MQQTLEITKESGPTSSLGLVRIKGSLNAHTSDDFERFFQEFIHTSHCFFIIDAYELEAVSSSGLSALLRLTDQLEGLGASFSLIHLSSEISMLFAFLGLNQRLHTFSAMAGAIAFLQEKERLNNLNQQSQQQNRQGGQNNADLPEVGAEPVVEMGMDPEAQMPPEPVTELQEQADNIIDCTHCGLPIRTGAPGAYMCPGCGERLQVQN